MRRSSLLRGGTSSARSAGSTPVRSRVMDVSLAGWFFLSLIGVAFPLLSVRTAFRVRRPGRTPTKSQHLVSVAITQFFSLFLAFTAIREEHLELFPRPEMRW